MLEILKQCKNKNHLPLRKGITFAAGLAINQGFPEVALEIMGNQQPNYVTVRNLRAIALANVGRVEDAFAILRLSIDYDSPHGKKRGIFKDAVRFDNDWLFRLETNWLSMQQMEAISQVVEASGDQELKLEFSRIEKMLTSKDLIESKVFLSKTLSLFCLT